MKKKMMEMEEEKEEETTTTLGKAYHAEGEGHEYRREEDSKRGGRRVMSG